MTMSFARPAALMALAALALYGCTDKSAPAPQVGEPPASSVQAVPAQAQPELTDPLATAETRALYANLAKLRQEHMLFGHQDDLAYGVTWEDQPGRSDVKEVAGSYPAIYGWELGGLGIDQPENLDKVNFAKMQGWIKEGYARGGVITISWHMYSPVTGANSWDKGATVHEIIPGGSKHEQFKAMLDKFVTFNAGLVAADGHAIPVIFRPWHEHNGDWFWWGKGHCSEEDYQALFRFTVDYLREQKGLHNLIYVFSPDRSRIDMAKFDEGYFYGYPGDKYVDVIGLDDYWDAGHESNQASAEEQVANLTASLKRIAQIARDKNKIAALSETGNNKLPIADFWTGRLLKAVSADADAMEIAYALVWRNANTEREKSEQFFAPYPGQASAADFVNFYQSPVVMFESELPDMYH